MATCRGSQRLPPPIIGKAGRYTIFITPPGEPEKPRPPVLPPPAQFQKPPPAPSPSSAFCFFWNALSKVQKVHLRVDECLANWLGLNQSKYQWALNEYYETKELGNGCLKPKDPTVGGKVLEHWTAC